MKPTVVTKDRDYVASTKIYNTGTMEGPVPGEKRGKGVQHLNSSYWLHDLCCFVSAHTSQLSSFVAAAASVVGAPSISHQPPPDVRPLPPDASY